VNDLDAVYERLIECTDCPRLVDWRRRVAADKRAAFRGDDYWGRPVPGFGDRSARLILVGLAPAAHGANRTGRMFTGDRSGDFLVASLHRTGFANQPSSVARGDGLELAGCLVTSVVKCAPPGNTPTGREEETCQRWLAAEVRLLRARVIVALGGVAYRRIVRMAPVMGWSVPRPRPVFGHGVEVNLGGGPVVICSYHPSQQNTFTGKLTPAMMDGVFARARELLES
jgi:uracil-DNA glycosylase family 4